MRRREFVTLLGTAAAAWPLATRAQQAGKLPTIGFLGAATPAAWGPYVAAFTQRVRELGWIEGRTVAIEYRWAEGRQGSDQAECQPNPPRLGRTHRDAMSPALPREWLELPA